MVCDDVKRVVYFYLDGALSEKRRTDFTSHLEECKDCGDRITIHKKLRKFVISRLERHLAPEALRQKIRLRFQSLRAQL